MQLNVPRQLKAILFKEEWVKLSQHCKIKVSEDSIQQVHTLNLFLAPLI